MGEPRRSGREKVPTQAVLENQQAAADAAAAKAARLAKLPPKIKKVLNNAETKTKADKLREKYTGRPVDITSPMSIAVGTWGPEAVADFLQHRDAVRYMYAPTNNPAQCIRAGLGDPTDPKKAAEMKCWLCDFLLVNPYTRTAYDTIVCEHVLPVYQAVMYADIALAKRPSTSTEELVASEYGWSHAVCNGPKSNRLFIVETRDRSNRLTGWKIDDNIIRQTLIETIPDIRSKGIDNGTLATKPAQIKWVDKCIKDITVRLNVFLNSLNHPDPGGYRISQLFSVSKLIDPERWASNVSINEQAYDAHAAEVETKYDEYQDRLVGDVLKDANILQLYPQLYDELGRQDWKIQTGRRRRKRNRKTRRIRKH